MLHVGLGRLLSVWVGRPPEKGDHLFWPKEMAPGTISFGQIHVFETWPALDHLKQRAGINFAIGGVAQGSARGAKIPNAPGQGAGINAADTGQIMRHQPIVKA